MDVSKHKTEERLECDLLVIGSGAGGLSAAVTAAWHGLKVIVAEKDDALGGTTACSGGWIWAPLNPLAKRAGIVEDIAAPRKYLQHVLGPNFDEKRVDRFLKNAPHMVSFYEKKTALQFQDGNHIVDTYGNLPGAGTGGRSVISAPYNGRKLGKLIKILRKPMRETTFLGLTIQAGPDLKAFMNVTRSVKALSYVGVRMTKHIWDLVFHGRAMQLRNGLSLVARLMKSADDLGVIFLTGSPATQLCKGNGKVIGAVLSQKDKSIFVSARKGVVLASGGFSHDKKRCAKMFPSFEEHLPLAVSGATGDGARLGETVGGFVDDRLAAPAAWCPVSKITYKNGTSGNFPHIIERGKPGIIGVLQNGQRFCNEGNGYYDYVDAMLKTIPQNEKVVSWLICTHEFQRKYGLGISRPSPLPIGPFMRSGYLKSADTIGGLAEKCGIDADGLKATMKEYNYHAAEGNDPLFKRGETPYNKLQGDPAVKPNPCVAPIEKGPFYAVEVSAGSFGTFAGLKVDDLARVLKEDATAVQGLYAVGADMASVMGGHYPAGGINLGPAMTFGYIVGRHAAGIEKYEDEL